ncbi:unnamed protein product [Rhizophagus irregularis]|nr:unnamed protein product [Rhizophagus irregularis]
MKAAWSLLTLFSSSYFKRLESSLSGISMEQHDAMHGWEHSMLTFPAIGPKLWVFLLEQHDAMRWLWVFLLEQHDAMHWVGA